VTDPLKTITRWLDAPGIRVQRTADDVLEAPIL
jgi:hypothetical protein